MASSSGVIPAHPLALTAARKLDERRQRALTRYYVASGVRGVAVGVHTTQFSIRDHGLLRPVLELAAQEAGGVMKIAGAVGSTAQATAEAELAAGLGYDAVLLSLAALREASLDQLIDHCRAVAGILPLVGFYLQPAVGGRPLPFAFWRRFAELDNVLAIKIAPFNRYQTLDVIRAVEAAGRRQQLELWTGNDDAIAQDLLSGDFDGGLLGHWAVWTREAVRYEHRLITVAKNKQPIEPALIRLGRQITDANAAFFDAANGFHGCIAGLHEILRRQGLLEGRWCLDPAEDLSPGQLAEIDRVHAAYPHLADDAFVREHLDTWLT